VVIVSQIPIAKLNLVILLKQCRIFKNAVDVIPNANPASIKIQNVLNVKEVNTCIWKIIHAYWRQIVIHNQANLSDSIQWPIQQIVIFC